MKNEVDYKPHRRLGITYIAPVQEHHHKTLQEVRGLMTSDGYVCMNPSDPSDKWFITKEYYEKHYREVEDEST